MPGIRSVRGKPNLIRHHCRHEENVEAEGPEDQEFGVFQVAAGNVMFFCFDELIGLELREDQRLVGGGDGMMRVFIAWHNFGSR